MGYVFLFIALIAGTTKGFCGKKTSSVTNTYSSAMLVNFVRMVLCAIIGFLILALQGNLDALRLDAITLMITLLSALASSVFVVSWLISVRSGAYMMVDVFLMLGIFVPILLCKIFFSEEISLVQWLGMAVLIISAYVMSTYNKTVKSTASPKAILLLIICGLSNGIADFSQKLFVKRIPDGSSAAFNLYTYAFSAIILLVAFLYYNKSERVSPSRIISKIWLYVLIMAICLFANSFFKTLAAKELDAIQLYPLNYGGGIILSLIMSATLFKERINRKCIIGTALAFLALMLLS